MATQFRADVIEDDEPAQAEFHHPSVQIFIVEIADAAADVLASTRSSCANSAQNPGGGEITPPRKRVAMCYAMLRASLPSAPVPHR